ncbi:hypothetical protein BMT55_12680 [Listeria newyorkensis]|uniref:DUF4352 domain-containing protein n=1 Tax=Listeria newyorkensis TaxID=1497681 RepID=A0ABX4XKW0_9LIST|nr:MULTISPECIES: DUF4352 domain-containing protein [Listeria]KGL42473.1 hypothetical protein EP56_09695 [Listeriaceae bacterium FSL A5-0209]KGL45612.1 hypothetical protein EP58_03860 [Listeria newyorkensis]PNP89348.1 hypothetical protein BMT55_12680 [Listeria newyorkensis]RQW66674.1 DUF4352 domain-containing protein [Listeria sp. SHR_NRA_18]WAO22921.1 DUF4352 domain-containing protein [Listeria newyorkensis]
MKNKKKFTIAGMVAILVLTVGLAINATLLQPKTDIGTTQDINGLFIKVADVQLVNNAKKVRVHFEVKNNTKQTTGIGAGNFHITVNKKDYQMTGGNNFGQEIAKGETITGDGYYEFPKEQDKVLLTYTSPEGETLTWDLGKVDEK